MREQGVEPPPLPHWLGYVDDGGVVVDVSVGEEVTTAWPPGGRSNAAAEDRVVMARRACEHKSSDGVQAIPRPPARDLAALREGSVRGVVVAQTRRRGHYDRERLITPRPHEIADGATRVRIGTDEQAWFALDTASARAYIRDTPRIWLDPVHVDTHPVEPVHVDPGDHRVYWSDGTTEHGEVLHPGGLRIGGTWPPHRRRLAAIEDLARATVRAANREDLGPVWTTWLDAETSGSRTVDERVNEVLIAAGEIAARTLTLVHHTVRHADGNTRELWELGTAFTIRRLPRKGTTEDRANSPTTSPRNGRARPWNSPTTTCPRRHHHPDGHHPRHHPPSPRHGPATGTRQEARRARRQRRRRLVRPGIRPPPSRHPRMRRKRTGEHGGRLLRPAGRAHMVGQPSLMTLFEESFEDPHHPGHGPGRGHRSTT
ncbi:hypothetical protein [Embleya sp. NPDC005971]|uniref:hypothetical protein n=1 Tax=Embleya sp. NPDC005971 TaxID=3156724 RepID=UPI003404C312